LQKLQAGGSSFKKLNQILTIVFLWQVWLSMPRLYEFLKVMTQKSN